LLLEALVATLSERAWSLGRAAAFPSTAPLIWLFAIDCDGLETVAGVIIDVDRCVFAADSMRLWDGADGSLAADNTGLSDAVLLAGKSAAGASVKLLEDSEGDAAAGGFISSKLIPEGGLLGEKVIEPSASTHLYSG